MDVYVPATKKNAPVMIMTSMKTRQLLSARRGV
jgi:hypothetical protein